MSERKTPRERAQEELDVAVRALKRAKARAERVGKENGALVEKYRRLADEKEAESAAAAAGLAVAQRRVEFLGANPDLNEDEATDLLDIAGDDSDAGSAGDDVL